MPFVSRSKAVSTNARSAALGFAALGFAASPDRRGFISFDQTSAPREPDEKGFYWFLKNFKRNRSGRVKSQGPIVAREDKAEGDRSY